MFDKATGSFEVMRNDLAHGGSVLDGGPPERAIERVRRVQAFAERVWEEVDRLNERWV
jgi:hypothetical protein